MKKKEYARNEWNQIEAKILEDSFYPELEYNSDGSDGMYYHKIKIDNTNEEIEGDWYNAQKGYIEGTSLQKPIPNSSNNQVNAWDINSYLDFMKDKPCPPTVHPYLWRMESLNNINGLFKVDTNIYQIRSFDLSTMSIVKSNHGWIVIDPLCGSENAQKGWEIFKDKVDKEAKLCAILITHSHVDHYKGAMGLIQYAKTSIMEPTPQSDFENYQFNQTQIPVITPKGFYDEAISENLYLGNCMSRRAVYMYGSALPKSEYGHVGSGLGKSVGVSTGTIPVPTLEVEPNSEGIAKFIIDGINITLQDVPGTEAPAEFHIYFEQYKTLCPGENVTHTLHNLLTSRGAKVRDPKAFGKAIDKAMKLFPDTEIIIGTHHWPTWGKDNCMEIMRKQRDMYYFFNDQVIRLLNKGMNMEEIADVFQLPESIRREFYNRGYYGTVNHDVKAVIQRYIGWWDGNPANYFKYTDIEAAQRFVEDMGGADEVLKKAKARFDAGDYRWVIELTRHVVFDPSEASKSFKEEAKNLEADAMEQLAYSFESGTWRNIFLSGAFELRGHQLSKTLTDTDKVSTLCATLKSLPLDYMFEYFTTLIDGFQAGNVTQAYCIGFGHDYLLKKYYNIWLENGVFHYERCYDENHVMGKIEDIVEYKSQVDFINDLISYLQNKSNSYPLANIFCYLDLSSNDWNIVEPLKQ